MVLLKLRNADGAPTLRFRLVALVVALAMLLIAVPLLLPVIRWVIA